jgi:hypothetical protein
MRHSSRRSGSGQRAPGRHRTLLDLERLDDRTVPSTFSVSNWADSGIGSLRQAIQDANVHPGADDISFTAIPSAQGSTITLTSGQLTISGDLTINGPGAKFLTVSGNRASRVFEIAASATASISGLTIADGTASAASPSGGGLLNRGTLTLTDSTVRGNLALSGSGGGLANLRTATVNSSTFSGNKANVSGSGLSNSGRLTLTDSTVSGNTIADAYGYGAIGNQGTLAVTSSTIWGNTGVYGVWNDPGTIGSQFGARNTIVQAVSGTVASGGHNLVGSTSGGGGFQSTDLLNVDPKLGPLQDNGGPTMTMAVQPGSSAQDAGDNSSAPFFDQRGFPRIVNGKIDVGAYELQATTGTVSTMTTLAVSLSPSSYHQPVTFTATVVGTTSAAVPPSGIVIFKDGPTILGTATVYALNPGPAVVAQAQFSTAALGGGTHTITAMYGGDSTFMSSTSVLTQVVNQAPSSVTATSLANPSTYRQTMTFAATVVASTLWGGTPTGTVTFKDGTTVLGTATLSGGGTYFMTSTLGAGDHAITAVYGGDSNFSGSASLTTTQTVSQAGTTTSQASSTSSSVYGRPVTFTATVLSTSSWGGVPSGTVTFKDGNDDLGTEALSGSGIATLRTSALGAGTHTIVAVYKGDSNFAASTAAKPLAQVVSRAGTAASMSSSGTTSVYQQPVTFTVTVLAAKPSVGTLTGTVTFMDGTNALGTSTLDAHGGATFTTVALGVSRHAISAVYSGDANFLSTTSPVVTQTVNPLSTTAILTSSAGSSLYRQAVTFTATVGVISPSLGPAAGKVTFWDGLRVLGTSTVDARGVATLSTSLLGVGNHWITATFAGHDASMASSLARLTQRVYPANTAVVLTSSMNPSAYRQAVTFVASVTPVGSGGGTPTGTVIFRDGSTILGRKRLNAQGIATLTVSSLRVRGHLITASFTGSNSYRASSSARLIQNVARMALTR